MGCLQALHFGADLVFWATCTCVKSATILNRIVLVLKVFLNTLVTFNFKKLPDVVGGTFLLSLLFSLLLQISIAWVALYSLLLGSCPSRSLLLASNLFYLLQERLEKFLQHIL